MCSLSTFRKTVFRTFTGFSLLILYEKEKKQHFFWTSPSDRNVAWRKEWGETGHEGQREDQELNNRMCSHNLDLETTTQSFSTCRCVHVQPFNVKSCLLCINWGYLGEKKKFSVPWSSPSYIADSFPDGHQAHSCGVGISWYFGQPGVRGGNGRQCGRSGLTRWVQG